MLCCVQVPIVLVGNKLDLAEQMREVPTNYAETVAKDWGLPFLETSAKYSTNVEEVFKEVVRLMVAASHTSRGRRKRGAGQNSSKSSSSGCQCTLL